MTINMIKNVVKVSICLALRIFSYPFVVLIDGINSILVHDSLVFFRFTRILRFFRIFVPFCVIFYAWFYTEGDVRGALLVAAVTWAIGSEKAAKKVFPAEKSEKKKIRELIEKMEKNLSTYARHKDRMPVISNGIFLAKLTNTETGETWDCSIQWEIPGTPSWLRYMKPHVRGHVAVVQSKISFDTIYAASKDGIIDDTISAGLIVNDDEACQCLLDFINRSSRLLQTRNMVLVAADAS